MMQPPSSMTPGQPIKAEALWKAIREGSPGDPPSLHPWEQPVIDPK